MHTPPLDSNNSITPTTNTIDELWITSYDLEHLLTQHRHARHPQSNNLLTCTLSYYIYTRGQTYFHQILETPTRPITVYILFLNSTRATHQITTYRGYKGGVCMLIHYKCAYSNNLSTITTRAMISSFLQIIRIANQPLQM